MRDFPEWGKTSFMAERERGVGEKRGKTKDLCTRVVKRNKQGTGTIDSLFKRPLTLHTQLPQDTHALLFKTPRLLISREPDELKTFRLKAKTSLARCSCSFLQIVCLMETGKSIMKVTA